jgi:hypothetical protein
LIFSKQNDRQFKMSQIKSFVNDRIYRQREKILGHALNRPYLYTLNGQSTWVVDVVVNSKEELLTHTPIAENNRQIKNFVSSGTPVELQRSNAGLFYISGLSDRQKGDVKKKSYKIDDYGFGYSQGWKKNSGGNYITGNDNTPDIGTEETINYYYVTTLIPFGSLDWGTTELGAYLITRYPA